ncbi:MAG: translation initiation factor, partial [Rhodococcus sp. (in: high G+C Gram-positive bacteria)]
ATPVVHQEIEPGPPPAPKTPAAKTPAAKTVATPQPAATAVPKPAAAPAKRTSKKVPAGVSVTIHAGADNDWSVTVAHGAKRPGKAVPVSPDAVERAVRELGEETAIEAVESIIVAARNLAAARVDELSRQLEDARKALEALGAVE